MRRQELSGSVQRCGRFVEDRVIGLEDVGYPGGDVEGDLDVGGGGLAGGAGGGVGGNLVGSGLDDQGREAGQGGEYGGDEGGSRGLSPRVGGGPVSGLEGVPQHVHAAVEVQDNMARLDSVDGDLGGRDAAQRGCGHGHAGGQRLRRYQLPEQPPLLVDVAAGGEG